jgi:nucleotide-binding universal stress UspA family protein
MFKNVLVGVDGRPTGRDAIALAARLVDPEGKLTLAHVHNDVPNPFYVAPPGMIEGERKASHELLERERAEAEISADLISVAALSPGAGLHEQAEEMQADLLVVGSCSRGVLGRVMVGDDTRAALNGAPCSVAVAARGYADHPTPFAKIGVGYNDSPESAAALAMAREVAQPTRASIHVLQVVPIASYAYGGAVPMGPVVEEILEDANKNLAELPDVQARAVSGLTGEELAGFSDQVDLLVVGSRGYGPLKRLVLGSTTMFLERHGRSSLLVLPRVAAA